MKQEKQIQLTAGQTWNCTVEVADDGDQEIILAHLTRPAAGCPQVMIMRGRLDGTAWMVSDGGGWLHDMYSTFTDALDAITDPGRRQILRHRTSIADEAYARRRKANELNDAARQLFAELEAGEPNIHIPQAGKSRTPRRRAFRS